MQIIECTTYGGPEVLKLTSAPIPQARKDEILIEIHAASVNPVDWKIRSGALKVMTGSKPPRILGSDFAGVVRTVGSDVNDWCEGDEVWGKFNSFKGGAYAQWVTAKSQEVSHKPTAFSWYEAAATPNTALTAYQAMVKRSGLQPGQCVLVNGASGGVGVMAVQIAKAMGCHVTAVCSAQNASLVDSLGADVVLDYRQQNILAAKRAYDVFFDCVSNQSYFKVAPTLKAGGVHIKTTPDLTSMAGQLLRWLPCKRPDHIMVKPSAVDLSQLRGWAETGQLKPLIEQVFPMSAVAEAHRLSEAGRVVGKLVLDMQAVNLNQSN